MRSFLLFSATVLAMLSLVPLTVLLASGSWRQTWGALREYLLVLAVLVVAPMALGVVIAGIGWVLR
jgi:hypothetical protein